MGPFATIGVEDTHKGSSRLGSKQTVWFGQGFTTCTKQTDSAGTCIPCNSAASVDPVESEVEEVVEMIAVYVAVSVETWAGAVVEAISSFA